MSLTNLLKKSSKTYERDEVCNEAFETLKSILVKAPVLKLPDFDKDFEIHFDAFDFVIGGDVLPSLLLVPSQDQVIQVVELGKIWGMLPTSSTKGG